MSYISFYRKWRPQAFSEVIGQEHIVKTLQNAISKNMLVHGYMFCGPKGTGKTSVARIFAKAINCVNGPAAEPCNKCVNCISITSGSNVDIVEIDGASNRGIENIRDLREKIKFLPVFLRKKIYIIDEAHQITDAAFNALLKTLEEPPEHVIFVMATTDPNKVIKTIMSRCQRFDFEPISLDGLRHRLKEIASSEKIDITDSALSIVAKYSDGSLRDAEGILEQLSSFSDGRITVDEVSSILGIIDQDMLFELANIILEKNINQGLLFVSRLFSTSFSLNAFISEFLEHLYNLYVIKNYENPSDIIDMPDDFKENYYSQAGLFNTGQLENLIDLFTGLLAQIKDSENPKTFFKAAVIKALNTKAVKNNHVIKNNQVIKSGNEIKNDQAIKKTSAGRKTDGEVVEKTAPREDVEKKEPAKLKEEQPLTDKPFTDKSISVLESNAEKNPDVKSAEDPSPDLKKSTGDFSLLILEIWSTLLMKIKEKKVFVEAKLKEVKRFRLQGNKIFFLLESKNIWHKDELNKLQNKELIQELLKSLTEEKFEITFDFINDENINESIELLHPARKIQSERSLPPGHKETLGFVDKPKNAGIPEADADGSITVSKKNSDVKDIVAGSDSYEYFEEKFKLKEL